MKKTLRSWRKRILPHCDDTDDAAEGNVKCKIRNDRLGLFAPLTRQTDLAPLKLRAPLRYGPELAMVLDIKMLLEVGSLPRRLLWNSGLTIAQSCLIGLSLISLSLTGCGAAGEQESPTPTGATVNLVWNPVNAPSIVGYYIHYGKQSPNQSGSCAYDRAIFASSHQGIVTGLDSGSTYYFAVSAYNGDRSDCSNEVHTQT